MKPIQAVTSEGLSGPAYIRFSKESVATTEPWDDRDDVIVDYDDSGAVVGVELITLDPDVIDTLLEVAHRNDLDLSALVAHSFETSPAI